jgi:carbon-monoxide dehydrogenase medium subunit
MNRFEFAEPRSLADAIDLLDTDDPTVRPFSGGTALMLMMKAGVFAPSRLVSLQATGTEHARIEEGADGSLRIGAMATLSAVEHSTAVSRRAPVIARTMRRLANVRVRNVARIGGNLAHGDPHMDLPPVLSALRATAIALGPSGVRRIPVEDLFAGYYETVLGQGELIAAVDVPPQAGWSSAYLKCTTRTADDWPALGVAVSLKVENSCVTDIRIVVSAATEKLTRLAGAESALRGVPTSPHAFAHAGEAAAAEAETIDDVRGSADYKTQLLRVYVRRALASAIETGAVS